MNETERRYLVNSPEGTDFLKVQRVVGIFHPSPAKRVRFPNGKVIAMNRKERRRNKLYGKNVIRVKSGG